MRVRLLGGCALIVIMAAGPPAARGGEGGQAVADGDRLYAQRENPQSARRAAEILAVEVQRAPADFDAAWRLARVRYWLGNHAPDRARAREYELGTEAARLAIAARPNRAEGHFWLGANLGGLAELGVIAGLRYGNVVRRKFETTARLDPAFEAGSAFTALGEWYLQVPGLLGGDRRQAERFLRRALTYDPNSTVTRYFLAQTLLASGRDREARAELQRVIEAPFDPDYTPEDREWKQKARDLLVKLGNPLGDASGSSDCRCTPN